ncbi:hypothetical protein DYH55_14015 [Methylovirgula sp. 4M-Z18]|nr:hypothetical protein DYH55_14015 [Methylovirgula sp. 4M-Z18]
MCALGLIISMFIHCMTFFVPFNLSGWIFILQFGAIAFYGAGYVKLRRIFGYFDAKGLMSLIENNYMKLLLYSLSIYFFSNLAYGIFYINNYHVDVNKDSNFAIRMISSLWILFYLCDFAIFTAILKSDRKKL